MCPVAVLHQPEHKYQRGGIYHFVSPCYKTSGHIYILIKMPRPKKQNPKQLNAAISWTFCHQSFQTSSPTQESTLASTIPPNSVPPSTIDPSDVPAIYSWDQSEGLAKEYSPGPEG